MTLARPLLRHSTAWYEALDAFIAQRRARPFAWGSQDCCTFAADWVQLATGQDPLAGLRGLDTALSARRALAEQGGLRALWDARLGPHQAGAFAQAGDLAMVAQEGGSTAMAVCVGSWLAVPGATQLDMLPVNRAEATWRV